MKQMCAIQPRESIDGRDDEEEEEEEEEQQEEQQHWEPDGLGGSADAHFHHRGV